MSEGDRGRWLARGRYLQVALDLPNLRRAVQICRAVPVSQIILEVGTPLLKSHGKESIRAIKRESKGRPVVADTKTLDAAEVEVKIAKEGGADGATVSALAPPSTIERFGMACRRLDMVCIVDLLGYTDDPKKARDVFRIADILVCHMGIDQGTNERELRLRTEELKRAFPNKLIAVAGGIVPDSARALISSGADIVVVGRYITSSETPGERAAELIELLSAP